MMTAFRIANHLPDFLFCAAASTVPRSSAWTKKNVSKKKRTGIVKTIGLELTGLETRPRSFLLAANFYNPQFASDAAIKSKVCLGLNANIRPRGKCLNSAFGMPIAANGPEPTLVVIAAKVGIESTLPKFCNAANGCY